MTGTSESAKRAPNETRETHTERLHKNENARSIWAKKEIDSALGEAAEMFDFHYDVQPHGNAPEGSDPQDEFRGKNILIERHTIAETAQHFRNIGFQPVRPASVSPADSRHEDEIRDLLRQSREKLFSIRARRPRPHLD